MSSKGNKKHSEELLADAGSLRRAHGVMRILGSVPRLEILCYLTQAGEMGVGELVKRVGLSGSAVSQHLAKLRELGVVDTRREAQRIYYRVVREDIERLMSLMHELYCGKGE